MFGSRLWPTHNRPPYGTYYDINSANPLSDNLEAWFLMNEGAGSINSLGNLYKGTNNATTVTWNNTSRGTALTFSGASTSYATFRNINFAARSFSISLWARVTAGPTLLQAWLTEGTGSLDNLLGLFFCGNCASPFVSFRFYTDDLTGTVVLSQNTWYHVVATFNNGTKLQSIYVNGVFDASRTATAALVSTTGLFNIGRNVDGGLQPFTGNLQNMMIYLDRVLTASEALKLFREPYGSAANPLLIVSPRRTYSIPQLGVESWGPNISQPAPPKYVILSF